MNSFDGVAPYYGSVGRLVYGKAIRDAQCAFINDIKKGSKVLLLGGGSGELLVELSKLNIPLEIDYLDSSTKMIAIAKGQDLETPGMLVNFHALRFQKFNPTQKYDVVITPFFLDCFRARELPSVLGKIAKMMKPKGSLLVTDFQIHKNSLWQKMMSKVMHLFFRVFSNLESDKLQDLNQAVSIGGFESIGRKMFYRNFIFSSHYQLVSYPKN